MASLIEELISNLDQEEELYSRLIPVAQKKTGIIVENQLDKLQAVTDEEQAIVDEAALLEHKRQNIIKDIGVVMNRDPETLNMQAIVDILQKQPEQQQRLRELHDKLKRTVGRLKEINIQNKQLVEDALEMIEFNMNYIRSTRMSSGSSNYNRDASEMSGAVVEPGVFDAKQ